MTAIIQANSITFEQVVASKRILSLPEVAVKLLNIAQQPEPDFDELIRVIRSDPAICAKVLRTVNSPFFGLRHRIENIAVAIPRLGLTMLKTILLGFHLARHKNEPPELKPILQAHWRSSITQAAFAELIGAKMEGGQPDNYFLAAMLQDIGILAMLSEAPQEYMNNVLNRADFPEVVSAEKSYFGFSHVEVSCAILKKWGVIDCFGDALFHHHDRVVPADRSRNAKMAIVLQAANLGTQMLFSNRHSNWRLDASVEQWLELLNTRLNIGFDKANEILGEVKERVTENSNLFSFDIGTEVCPDQVIQDAAELLQEITLNHQLEQANRSHQKTNSEQDLLYLDGLCGLYNRRYMNDKLFSIFQQASENNHSIAAVFIDVDKFKSINDRFGHATGDMAIQSVANYLRKSIRPQDIAIRFGGDEFIVIFLSVTEMEFENIINRMNSSNVNFEIEEEPTVQMSLSIGGIYIRPNANDIPNPNWMIDQADQAMYSAKRKGGGQCSVRKYNGTQLCD